MRVMLKNIAREVRDRIRMSGFPRPKLDVGRLRALSRRDLSAILRSQKTRDEWKRAEAAVSKLGLPASTGGVNPGDQRADVRVLPLGELEWPTKLGARVTSLAIVTRDQ